MKSRGWLVSIPFILVFVFVLATGARSDQDGDHGDRDCRESEHYAHNLKTPLKLVGGIRSGSTSVGLINSRKGITSLKRETRAWTFSTPRMICIWAGLAASTGRLH
jgi:hypothetical protein